LTFLGLAEFNLGEYNDSIKHYKKAISIDSSMPMPYQVNISKNTIMDLI